MPDQSPSTSHSASADAARMVVRELGLIAYAEALKEQRTTHARVLAGAPNELLLCEHPHVYTMGSQTNPDHVLLDQAEYASLGAELVKTDRGGDVTYHGPGQIVGYPIFALDRLRCGRDLHLYLRAIEQALIDALASFEITASRNPGKTGVWVDGEKIAAIGLKCKRWVSMHGFALNYAPDLNFFSKIVPCGLSEPVTSMRELLGERLPARAQVEAALEVALEDELFG